MNISEWTRKGECNNCGWCCDKVAREAIVRTDEQIARDPAFYAARGFKPMDVDGARRHVLFAWLEAPCPQRWTVNVPNGLGGFSAQSRCAVYNTRPQTCVSFPRLPVDIVGTPCSYWFEREAGIDSATYKAGGQGSPWPIDEAKLYALENA
jgi:Fe-S-cluster containining protein